MPKPRSFHVANFTEIINELSGIIGREQIKSEPDAVAKYSVDDLTPRAVVFPANTKEVSEVMRCAHKNDISMVVWGSGTKMGMGNPPKNLDLVLCTKRMNHMLDVDVANLTITVEAGVKFRDIQARLGTQEDRCYLPIEDLETEADEFICSDRSHSGCFLPIDPLYAEKATIGGIIAANSTGPRRLLYNLPRDQILGVRFVTPQGDIIGSGGKTVKNVSGYDISKLMLGSFGSLGVITEITLRLLPLPEKMETVAISFGSFADAAACAEKIFETTLLPAAVEVMNDTACEALGMQDVPKVAKGGCLLAAAFEAFTPAVERMKKEILEMGKAIGSDDDAVFSEDDHRVFWLKVSDINSTLKTKSPGLIGVKYNYPISEWKGLLEFAKDTLDKSGLEFSVQAHSGNGISHINLLLAKDDSDAVEKGVKALDQLLEKCLSVEGNMVVQNAPVELKNKLKVWGKPGSDFVAMKRIKEEIDPAGIMSKGRYIGGL